MEHAQARREHIDEEMNQENATELFSAQSRALLSSQRTGERKWQHCRLSRDDVVK